MGLNIDVARTIKIKMAEDSDNKTKEKSELKREHNAGLVGYDSDEEYEVKPKIESKLNLLFSHFCFLFKYITGKHCENLKMVCL